MDNSINRDKSLGLDPRKFNVGDIIVSVFTGTKYEVVEPDKNGMAILKNLKTNLSEQLNAHNNPHFNLLNKSTGNKFKIGETVYLSLDKNEYSVLKGNPAIVVTKDNPTKEWEHLYKTLPKNVLPPTVKVNDLVEILPNVESSVLKKYIGSVYPIHSAYYNNKHFPNRWIYSIDIGKDIYPFAKDTEFKLVKKSNNSDTNVLNPKKVSTKEKNINSTMIKQNIPTKPEKLNFDYLFSSNSGDRKSPTQSAGQLRKMYGGKPKYERELFNTVFQGNDKNWYKLIKDKNDVWRWEEVGNYPIMSMLQKVSSKDEFDIDEKIALVKQKGKPLSEFKNGEKVFWADVTQNGNFKSYVEGTVLNKGNVYSIKRFPQNEEAKKYPVADLDAKTKVVLKPENEAIYTGKTSFPKDAKTSTVTKLSKPEIVDKEFKAPARTESEIFANSFRLEQEWRKYLETNGVDEQSKKLQKELFDYNKKHFAVRIKIDKEDEIVYGQVWFGKISGWIDESPFTKVVNDYTVNNDLGNKVGWKQSRGGGSMARAFTPTKENAELIAKTYRDKGYKTIIEYNVNPTEKKPDGTTKSSEVKMSEPKMTKEKYFDKYLKELTPRNVAKRLIYVYVLRGDTLSSLKSSMMGSGSKEHSSSIGGYLNGKNIGTDKIIVQDINNKVINEIFSLKEIYNEILEEATTNLKTEAKPIKNKPTNAKKDLEDALAGAKAYLKYAKDNEKTNIKSYIRGLEILLK